jgi:DNA-binding NarL/FixJ family response regulator
MSSVGTSGEPQPAVRAVRVVVCEDVPELRALVCRALAAHDGLEVVDRAGSARDALRLARMCRPDVLVLDLRIDEDGVSVVLALSRDAQSPAIVLFSALGPDALPPTLRGCVTDHVSKTAGLDVLAERVLAAGRSQT